VYEPLLSVRACESPFEVLPRGDRRPDDRDDPLVYVCEGDRDRFEASLLSRRIVPCVVRLRLRLAVWRADRPVCAVWSASSSLSERLCLRFPAVARSDEGAVGAASGWLEALVLGSVSG
jgi:hypothetical protein